MGLPPVIHVFAITLAGFTDDLVGNVACPAGTWFRRETGVAIGSGAGFFLPRGSVSKGVYQRPS